MLDSMNLNDYILNEEEAIERVRSRKPMTVRSWLNTSPFISQKIQRERLSIAQAMELLGRPKSSIINFKKIGKWPNILVSKIYVNSDKFLVKDVLWLAERKKTFSEIIELVELHICNARKIPSTKISSIPLIKKKGTIANERYLSEVIKSKTVVEGDKIIIQFDDDIALMREILARIWI